MNWLVAKYTGVIMRCPVCSKTLQNDCKSLLHINHHIVRLCTILHEEQMEQACRLCFKKITGNTNLHYMAHKRALIQCGHDIYMAMNAKNPIKKLEITIPEKHPRMAG